MVASVLRLACCAAIAVATFPASAEGQTPAQAASAPQVWEADWVSPHCTISTATANEASLTLWMTPGDPDPELYLVGPAKAVPDADRKLTITLLPAGRTFQVAAEAGPGSVGKRVLKLSNLPGDFPAAFGASNAVRVSGRTTVTASIRGATQAMAAIHHCIHLQLSKWGIDANAYEALRQAPEKIEGLQWFTNNDYPVQAGTSLRDQTVVARVDVDVQGTVTSCNVVQPSGAWSLDSATCRAALKRLKFHPAIGGDGQPTAAQRIIVTVFRLFSCSPGHRCSS